jgi:hypothetical protein
MQSVYVVVENGEAYPVAYTHYLRAVTAVKDKYKDIIEENVRIAEEYQCMSSCSVDDPENIETGITYLYIEKEIHIYIYKLPIIQ